jgi:excisionase family DNA binding protein
MFLSILTILVSVLPTASKEVAMSALPLSLYEQVSTALSAAGRTDLVEQLQAYRPAIEVLTSSQAAALLGVSSPNTVKNWLKGGYFPGAFQTAGGHWRFPRADVESARAQLDEIRDRNRRKDHTPPDLGDDDSSPPLL